MAAGPIDLSAYRVQFASSSAVDWTAPSRTVPLTGTVAPGASVLIASKYLQNGTEIRYKADVASTWFSAGVAAKGGRARLTYTANMLQADGGCAPIVTVIDEVTWTNMPPGPNVQLTHVSPGVGVLPDATCTPPSAPASPPPTGASTPKQPPSIPAMDTGLLAPQISELFPNPAAPATDTADEYVEVYNPNDAPFELSGFVLKTGLKGTYSFTFSQGTVLAPHGFSGFLAKDTKLVLSNTAGKAILLDPLGAVLAETDAYGKAAAGQTWVFANNVWQWTSEPTFGRPNIVATPAVPIQTSVAKTTSTKKSASAGATKPSKAVKAAKTSARATKKTKAQPSDVGGLPIKTTATAAASPSGGTIHPAILAVFAILAVLYGAYEYRHDVANKIQQFRANRAARAAAGQSTKGR